MPAWCGSVHLDPGDVTAWRTDCLGRGHGALAGSLSGGQRKMLGIAKALASSPRLLVVDEPSAGLSSLLVGRVIEVLSRFLATGLAMLVSEQNVAFLDLADRLFILDGGRIGFDRSVAALEANDSLQRTYFGFA